ncbi:hypothetical protein KEM55_006012 [Ascosphaera atra]|nr:hypothetical protein KEM55_006012 [Ascosphaera atra]
MHILLAVVFAVATNCGAVEDWHKRPSRENFDYDVFQYIDPLIGTANGGNVFPGASLPYGMAKAVADTDSQMNQGGFTMDGANITGFSTLHDSGTGGSPSLGNFALFPHVGCKDDDINGCVFPKRARKTSFDAKSVVASPGYFSVDLPSGVKVEMTAAQHTSLFKMTFQSTESPLVLMDLTDLDDSRQDNATIEIDSKGRMRGSGVFLPSFGTGNYQAFFCADFTGTTAIRDGGIFVDSRATTESTALKISRSINGYRCLGAPGIALRRGMVLLC